MSILYYLILTGVLLLIIEIIAILFKMTGLDIEKSRFQIISIITHTGFTTRESELISQHPTRRRFAGYLMIVSYIGQAGFISIFINIVKEKKVGNLFIVIFILVLFILIFTKNKLILAKIDQFIEKTVFYKLRKNKKYKSVDEVLKLNSEYGVGEIVLEVESYLCGLSLRDAKLKEKNIQLLNVDRGDVIIHFPTANLVFQEADKIVVYGKIESIIKLKREQE